jgi:hypothetical protein
MPGKGYSFFIMSYNRSPIGKCLLKIINQTFPLLLENITYSFPITLLVYISLYRVMKTNAIFLAIGVAAVLAVIIAPALVVSASAAIRDVCEKNGSIKEGECKGNTDKNGKDDERVNNNDFAPPGQNKDD